MKFQSGGLHCFQKFYHKLLMEWTTGFLRTIKHRMAKASDTELSAEFSHSLKKKKKKKKKKKNSFPEK